MSFILVEQDYNKNKSKKNKYLDKTVLYILDKLLKDDKINKSQSDFYKDRIYSDTNILEQLRDIVFDISNNPNLLQKDKWSSRNIVLDQTNKCIPCKRKAKK